MKNFANSLNGVSMAAFLLLSAPVSAGTVSVDFQLTTSNGNPVKDLFIYSTAPGQESLYSAPDVLAPSGVQNLTYTVPFDPVSTLIVGLNPAVPGGSDHIIMFANDGFAAAATGVKWSAFFAPVRHSEFVSWLAAGHNGDAAALGSLSAFFQSSQAATAFFANGGPATILEFTTGGGVGAVIPEARTASVGLLCLGLVSWAFTRRMGRAKAA